MVQPNFFKLTGIPLRGNTFSGDTTARMPGPTDEIIISESLARRLWPTGGELGSRMRPDPHHEWMTVVGVAGDIAVPGKSGPQHELQVHEPALTRFIVSTIVFRQRIPLGTLMPAPGRALPPARKSLSTRRPMVLAAVLFGAAAAANRAVANRLTSNGSRQCEYVNDGSCYGFVGLDGQTTP